MKTHDRAVYIGGFLNGVSPVAEELEKHYATVEAFTFADAMRRPEEVARALKGATAWTHSGGALAAERTEPNALIVVNGPVPTSVGALVGKTLLKTGQMNLGVRSREDLVSVAGYSYGAARELVRDGWGHFKHLGAISRFDTPLAAAGHKVLGVGAVNLVYTDRDLYFQPSSTALDLATSCGVNVMGIEGVHDELPLRPHRVIPEILETAQL